MNLLNEGEKKMKDINKILDELEKLYPDAQCELNYETPFELLVATILSAQKKKQERKSEVVDFIKVNQKK